MYERALAFGFERNGLRDTTLICATLDFEESQALFDSVLDGNAIGALPDLPETREWLRSQPGLVDEQIRRLNAPHFVLYEYASPSMLASCVDEALRTHTASWSMTLSLLQRVPDAARRCDEMFAAETVRHRRLTLSGVRIRLDPPCDFAQLESDGIYTGGCGFVWWTSQVARAIKKW